MNTTPDANVSFGISPSVRRMMYDWKLIASGPYQFSLQTGHIGAPW